MKSVVIRGSVVAAIASIFVLNYGITAPAHAQQTAALAANPELAAKGVWNATTNYVTEDIVTARGSAWIAKRNNKNKVPGQTQPSTAADWQLFARGFNPAGAWLNSTTYQPDDLVTHQGQTWRAKRTIAAGGAAPTAGANWELLAAKGTAGANTGIGMGSQNAPSISFAGDPNTGMFSPSDGRIALVENGALVLHNPGTNNTALGRNAMGANTSVGSGNTALGAAALFAVTSVGSDNTAVGHSALVANTNGNQNTAVGKNALSSNLTDSDNTAVGFRALEVSTASSNTAIGSNALALNTTGGGNVAVGVVALGGNTEGFNNTAVGTAALSSTTTGSYNTAVGQSALAINGVGIDNTAVGGHALVFNTGSRNTALGRSALRANTTAVNNVGIGPYALLVNTTGGDNVAVGYNALTASNGSHNIAVGKEALVGNTSGNNNVAIGEEALKNNQSSSGSIAIGHYAGRNANDSNNAIYIGNVGENADGDGAIRIGTDGTHAKTFIAGITGVTVANEATVAINTATGQLGVVASSRRYKEDIAPMGEVNGTLMKLRPVTFHYKAAHDGGTHALQYGLIAEEVAEVMPYLAAFNKDGAPETVKYHLLPSFLLAGYQAQQNTIAALTERDRQQSAKVEALEDRLRRLEALLPQTKAASLQ